MNTRTRHQAVQILIIEDNVLKARGLKRVLQRLGTVHVVDNAYDAYDAIASNAAYHLIITDWDFPAFHGQPEKPGMGRHIAEFCELRKKPFAVYSSHNRPESVPETWIWVVAGSDGAFDVLTGFTEALTTN